MRADHQVFLTGIDYMQLVTITFFSKEDPSVELTRTCAPIDYVPSSHTEHKSDRYHLWNPAPDAPEGSHTLSLLPERVISIELTEETFFPDEFLSWKANWHYAPRLGPQQLSTHAAVPPVGDRRGPSGPAPGSAAGVAGLA